MSGFTYIIVHLTIGAALGVTFIPFRKRFEFEGPALAYWTAWVCLWPLVIAYGIERALTRR